MKFVDDVLKLLRGAKSAVKPTVIVSDTGFEIVDEKKRRSALVAWADIVKIRCFKRDRITTDEVYLAITFLKSGQMWTQEVSEDLVGFDAFVEQLQEQLKLAPPDWFSKVVSPAFSRNELTIFDR